MKIIVVNDKKEMGRRGAQIFAEQIKQKPNSLLGLATGSTPIPLYSELVRRCKMGQVDFSMVRSVNLDEYIGLEPTHNQSYRYFMQKHLFDYINIKTENYVLPNGMSNDTVAECRHYNDLIENWGGIDLQLLGLGHNGHIGFNEPGTEFTLGTHVVEIAEKTRNANSRFFDGDENKVPQKAITMGIGNIMKAKRIVLLVSGKDKAEILYKSLCGGVTPQIPASVLQLHNHLIVIADKEAAHLFDNEICQVL